LFPEIFGQADSPIDSACPDARRIASADVDHDPYESIREMIAELKNGRNTIAMILKPLCEGPVMALEVPQRRYVLRLLEDFKELIEQLEARLPSGDSSDCG
jgi:hypothetical protein